MKNTIFLILLVTVLLLSCSSNSVTKPNSDLEVQQKTELAMQEANRQTGMPAITNYQEKRNLKWIYELCDQENLICHAYFFNELKGEVGQYLGECIGYGIPYSTQYSNPEKVSNFRGDYGQYATDAVYTIAQPEPNGLFKPEGLSATWLIMVDPNTKEPRPVYIEPQIIVSPFKLK